MMESSAQHNVAHQRESSPEASQWHPYTQRLHSLQAIEARFSRHLLIAGIMLMALIAFELFNFDTTRYALTNLIGEVRVLGVGWSTILALAFCFIDFAGLFRLLTPEQGADEPKEVWYLMGAWLLGATMNAIMTWWAVSLTLLDHQLGNEILSRETMLKVVPIFVAFVVWLTRVLFIASLTLTSEKLIDVHNQRKARKNQLSQKSDRSFSPIVVRERTEADPPSRRPHRGVEPTPVLMMDTELAEEEMELPFAPPPKTVKRTARPNGIPHSNSSLHDKTSKGIKAKPYQAQ